MAIELSGASLIIHASKLELPFKDVLMLGRQSLRMTTPMVGHLQQAYGADLGGVDWERQTWAEPLFEKMGATKVESMDYSDYEGAAMIHDMNREWPHGGPPRQFDVVFDGGTLEHIFNLPQALLNAMSLVKVGGCFLSVTPSDGWLGHGFHQLQPELFFRFFTPERGFKIRGVWLAEYGRDPAHARFFRLNDPAVTGCRTHVPGRRPLEIVVMAEKVSEQPFSGTPLSWPGQSNYVSMWQDSAEGDSSAKPGMVAGLRKGVLNLMPRFVMDPIRMALWKRKYARDSRAGWDEVRALNG